MMRWTNRVLLLAAILFGTGAPSFAASPPNALDLPPSGVTPPPVDMLQTAPMQQSTSERPRELSGNPLWAIPLSSLTATRERPLFTPSRRPPAPAIAGPPPVAPVAAPVASPEPDRLQLTLVGAVVGNSGGIAIFIDPTTNDVVRLKTGDRHSGWLLQSVKGREASFQKNNETVTLALPALNAVATPGPLLPPTGATPFLPSAPGGPVPILPTGGPVVPGPNGKLPPGWSKTPTGEIVNTE
jgi:general secretion pathway protein N